MPSVGSSGRGWSTHMCGINQSVWVHTQQKRGNGLRSPLIFAIREGSGSGSVGGVAWGWWEFIRWLSLLGKIELRAGKVEKEE